MKKLVMPPRKEKDGGVTTETVRRQFLGRYILDEDKEPVPCPDVVVWANWIEGVDRQTAETFVGKYRVSTVFLGLDHSFGDVGPPVLWETMVFPEPRGGEIQERYSSRKDALAGHKKVVKKMKDAVRRKKIKA